MINKLGIDGFIFMLQLDSHIPAGFRGAKVEFIKLIMKSILAQDVDVHLMKELESITSTTRELCGKPPLTLLWQVHS